jgi:hypothetical protein
MALMHNYHGNFEVHLTVRLTPKNITRGLDMLRDMKSLKTIGIRWRVFWPAAEFWERYDKGEFKEERGVCCRRLSLPPPRKTVGPGPGCTDASGSVPPSAARRWHRRSGRRRRIILDFPAGIQTIEEVVDNKTDSGGAGMWVRIPILT